MREWSTGGRFNPVSHVDVYGWIERLRVWVIVTHNIALADIPDERPRGMYISRAHDTSCGGHMPADRPYKNREAKAAQQEVRDDPQLAAEVERLWRERSSNNDGTKG